MFQLLICTLSPYLSCLFHRLNTSGSQNSTLNAQSSTYQPELIQLLFALCAYMANDYQLNCHLNIKSCRQNYIKQHLVKTGCPIWSQDQGFQQLRNNGRRVLMAIGWVMAVSNFYERIKDCFKVSTTRPKRDQIGIKTQKLTLHDQGRDFLEQVQQVNRLVEDKFNQSRRLVRTRDKLMERLGKRLKENNIEMSPQSYIQAMNSVVDQDLQQELEQQLAEQTKLMRLRKQFWIWLESVVAKQKSQFQQDPNYGFAEQVQFIEEIKVSCPQFVNEQTDKVLIECEKARPLISSVIQQFQKKKNKLLKDMPRAKKKLQKQISELKDCKIVVLQRQIHQKPATKKKAQEEDALLQQLDQAQSQMKQRIATKLQKLQNIEILGMKQYS